MDFLYAFMFFLFLARFFFTHCTTQISNFVSVYEVNEKALKQLEDLRVAPAPKDSFLHLLWAEGVRIGKRETKNKTGEDIFIEKSLGNIFKKCIG